MSVPGHAQALVRQRAAALAPAAAKAVYRAAIDAGAQDGEGATWWAEVIAEVQAVVAAPDARSAATLIAWWHADWRAIGDTPARAAQRLRRAARTCDVRGPGRPESGDAS